MYDVITPHFQGYSLNECLMLLPPHFQVHDEEDLSQTFIDIRAVKVMNMYQILSIYLTANKHYGPKTEFQGNLKLVVPLKYNNIFI